MTERAYLDWNASAPVRVAARKVMSAALELCGNPSSVHGEGRAARRLIEQAREDVAALVGAQGHNVIFTSGGTEANALALSPAMDRRADTTPFDRLLIVQALDEGLTILTSDRSFEPYRVPVVWA